MDDLPYTTASDTVSLPTTVITMIIINCAQVWGGYTAQLCIAAVPYRCWTELNDTTYTLWFYILITDSRSISLHLDTVYNLSVLAQWSLYTILLAPLLSTLPPHVRRHSRHKTRLLSTKLPSGLNQTGGWMDSLAAAASGGGGHLYSCAQQQCRSRSGSVKRDRVRFSLSADLEVQSVFKVNKSGKTREQKVAAFCFGCRLQF